MTESSEGKQVCVIGLGNMGSALAEALLTSGHSVTVWNRTTSKCDGLAAAGHGHQEISAQFEVLIDDDG